jgi:hypothetical protein
MRKKLTITILLTLLCITIIPSPLNTLVVKAATPQWNIQTLDSNGSIGSSSIAIDSQNHPHISYAQFRIGGWSNIETPANLMYTTYNGTAWNIQTIGLGESPSLILDSDGNPHISYWGDSGLMYASWMGSTWNIQTVDQVGGGISSIFLDSHENPHICYNFHFINTDTKGVRYETEYLKYASWNGSKWNFQTIDVVDAYDCTLVLDSMDNPHVSYSSGSGLNYGSWNGTGWNIQTIDQRGQGDSLALDIKDNPSISYCYGNLLYLSWNGTGWNKQTVHNNGNSSYDFSSSLVLDSKGNPHISYATVYPSGTNSGITYLMYANWNGTGWDNQIAYRTVEDELFGAGGYSSIGVDSNGNPYISATMVKGYLGHGGNYYELKYAFAMINQASTANEVFWAIVGVIVASGVIVVVAVIITRFIHRKNDVILQVNF